MVAGEVESSCQLVATFFFFFFFFLVSPYQTIEISLGQPSPPSYQLLPPPLTLSKVLHIYYGITLSKQRHLYYGEILSKQLHTLYGELLSTFQKIT